MPSKYIQRQFVENGYYHIFNRGNAKHTIFHDEQDYNYFLSLFDCYLVKESKNRSNWITRTYEESIDLIAFCLMPNHFHLCIRQNEIQSMAKFMHSLSIRYATYYNKKYTNVGHVFQNRYKARLITDDIDLLHITRYIHQNPSSLNTDIETYSYSSMPFYTEKKLTPLWCKPTIAIEIFQSLFGTQNKNAHYREFVLTDNKLS